jgi:hypothetical protein
MPNAMHIPAHNRRFRAGPLSFLAFLALLLSGVPGCAGGGAGAYGPVGYPVCTCCCGGVYDPVAYKQTNAQISAAKAPSVASLFDTKGPMANVSANRNPMHKKAKGHK